MTAVLITHNPGDRLEETLQSLKWAEALLIMDRGSTDGTLALARRYTEQVHFHPAAHLATVINAALEMVATDWVLLIQPGETVEDMLRHEIEGVMIKAPETVGGYRMKGRVRFQGDWLGAGGPQTDCGIRLFRQGRGCVADDLSAAITVPGDVRTLDRPLIQEPYRTLQDMFDEAGRRSTLQAYATLDESGHSFRNTSLLSLFAHAKWAGIRHFFLQGGLTDGRTGFAVAMARSLETFLTFAKMRMLTVKR